jgi:cytochrome P450
MRPNYNLPAHVPTELIVDVDIYDMPNADVDAQLAWRVFQGKGPLVYSLQNGGHWVATSGKDIFRFLRATEIFSSDQIVIPDPGPGRLLPAQCDPPDHGRYRANIQGFFSPKSVELLDADVRSLTVALIEEFRCKGECEFVSQFGLQLPLTIFLRIMGLPITDRERLRKYVEDFAASPDLDQKLEARSGIQAYLKTWIAKRTIDPGSDAISRVIQSEIDGRAYTEEEVLSTLSLLLHAGLDTVAMMLSFIALHLARNAKDRDFIRGNPEKMQRIVQELLRRYTGSNVARILAVDHVHEGVMMKKGDRILLSPTFFNMDQETLVNPDEIDFTRDVRHVTFGAGPHSCVGAILARREVTIFLEEWLARIPDFEVDPDRPLIMSASQQNSITELWLKWKI